MKIFRSINIINDCYLLQHDLHQFEQYCTLNKLDLNISKCYKITFTRKPNFIQYFYTINNIILTEIDEIRDLGVLHDSKFLYDKHIDHITKKAYKTLGFVMRVSSQFSNVKVLKILYGSLVRSLLEYASQAWNPMYDVYVNRIESIQRGFLRFFEFKCKVSDNHYEARCLRHHILPLHKRRQIADIVMLSKIAQSKIDSPYLLSKICLKVPTRRFRNPIQLFVSRISSYYRANSYFNRMSNNYNLLAVTHDIDLFISNPQNLKTALVKHWSEN
ncbi:hypothetical protein K1T71_011303 [Dendrolimus kikuchii]|uniref:Uncharacterized protein n=1 Tax=Dendrolimus kikuchii TaxID=765133 RepID=A0ACC1CNT1_9NEOP|nr:hypothetical protein K1T71_011303 [Dendrolimus kikuchii]